MRKLLRWLLVGALVVELAVEYLAFPGLLALIGWLNGFEWQYYVVTIGGYGLLVILAEWIGGLLGKRVGRGIGGRLGEALKNANSSDPDIAS